MHSGVPTGTVTFLFTDIEGSTRLAQEQRASWENLRQRHGDILTAAMQAEGGFVFEVIGDAFSVAFHTPADAVRAAARAQRDLDAEPWGSAPIRVRMGIHTGAAEAVEGHYRGYLALSSVQRVMSAAHGGQVLLSQAAFELAQDGLPDGVATRDLGTHRLKDLQRPQRLFQLVIPSLPSNFPPPKTLDLHPHNLPVQLTSFVGREQEIGDLMQRVGAARLITLTGIAGTGKTRLGVQVAAEVMDDFEDGTWLVELAAILEPGSVPQAVASALNLREQPGRSPEAVLKDFVSRRRLLIVMDNCEHLLEECAAVVDSLLHSAPHLVVLATSRQALGITGESIYPVAPLSLPQSDAASASAVAGFDATRLFVDRMAAVQPGFTLSDENAPDVGKIVTRVDGIPLALELAAARGRGMTLEQLASRLDDRFRLLTGGSRTAPARQRTLRATIDWSHDLLAEAEQALFRRLGVFVGGWTSEAARAITPGGPLKEGDVDAGRKISGRSGCLQQPIPHAGDRTRLCPRTACDLGRRAGAPRSTFGLLGQPQPRAGAGRLPR